jgi:hypothetical protein
MRVRIHTVFVYAFVALSALAIASASFLHAQITVGTWVKQPGPNRDDITMTVEPCCNGGRRLTYHIKIGNDTIVMLVESPFNGTEVPVLVGGKPSGETMAIKTIDSRHWECVLKMNGKPFGTSKGELSADGKTLTVENNITFAAANQQVGIQKEVWIKK